MIRDISNLFEHMPEKIFIKKINKKTELKNAVKIHFKFSNLL